MKNNKNPHHSKLRCIKLSSSNKAQVSIFIIIGIVLAVSIFIFVMFRYNLNNEQVPAELQEVYNYYSECIKQETKIGLEVAGMQGGKIKLEKYVPGSEYAPFSPQLNFLDSPVPYWYYI